MDYEKKYEQALERAREAKQNTESAVTIGILEEIFPELNESEDERMKKELIKFLQECHNIDSGFFSRYCEIPFAQMLAWLEKQGTSYTKRDIDDAYVEGMAFAKGEFEKQGEQKPAWTAQDEERLQSCLNILQAKGIMGVTETINTKWLKELKQRIGG